MRYSPLCTTTSWRRMQVVEKQRRRKSHRISLSKWEREWESRYEELNSCACVFSVVHVHIDDVSLTRLYVPIFPSFFFFWLRVFIALCSLLRPAFYGWEDAVTGNNHFLPPSWHARPRTVSRLWLCDCGRCSTSSHTIRRCTPEIVYRLQHTLHRDDEKFMRQAARAPEVRYCANFS